jgi:hypothetical protein
VGADDIAVNLAATPGLEISSGLKIKPDTVTAGTLGLTLTANGAGIKYNTTSFTESSEALTLAAGVAGDGLDLITNTLSVKVDASTIEINSDTLRVKDAGITYAKIQNVTEDRLLGRNAGSTGVVQEITIGSGLAWGANDATINHADTSSVGNVDTSGAQIIDTITFDTYGHVQTVTTRNIVLDDINDVTLTGPVNGQALVNSSGSWINQTQTGNLTYGFIENVTGTTVDLDANDGNFKDVDGTNVVMTVASDNAKMHVYKNGQRIFQTGSLTSRDYDFGAGEVITFAIALTTSDRVLIEKWG